MEGKRKDGFKTRQYAALFANIKKIAFVLLGIVFALSGLFLVPNLLYNACGLFGGQDSADGPRWVLALIVLASVVLIGGAFFLSFYLFRLVDFSEHSN